ncbi:hypothetical protein [uncultured Gimesia sp.]|uniref:hypothetical protein n=1 Tax=uncultured Gimesia sp. TaxID=1678688 RepID=UPI002609E599|nr:hypothetical protein [uncultured Gimesia sp.]
MRGVVSLIAVGRANGDTWLLEVGKKDYHEKHERHENMEVDVPCIVRNGHHSNGGYCSGWSQE